jgi:type IV secretory pathway TrbF-like protein
LDERRRSGREFHVIQGVTKTVEVHLALVDRATGEILPQEVVDKVPTALVDRTLAAELKRWIIDTRSIFGDTSAMKTIEAFAFDHVVGDARIALTAYLSPDMERNPNGPYALANDYTVTIDKDKIIAKETAAGRTYQLTWVEHPMKHTGETLPDQIWTATITVGLYPVRLGSREAEVNPLGWVVKSYSWQRVK